MPTKPLAFTTLPTGCYIPTSHKTNHDGYFRYTFGSYRKGEKKAVMFHRYLWEAVRGPIPDGFEINHKCRNRACCNLDHLECLPGSDHASLSNKERYLAPSGVNRK